MTGRRRAETGHRRGERRLPIRLLLCCGVLAAPAIGGTFAHWTDDVAITGATFAAGTLDLTVNGSDPHASASLTMAAMVPGSSAAEVMTVANAGTAPAKYTLTGGLSGAQAADFAGTVATGLSITIRHGAGVSAAGGTCTGGSGELLPATALTTSTGAALVARRPTAPLAPGASETLCVQITLGTSAPSSLQGKTASLTLTATGTSDVS